MKRHYRRFYDCSVSERLLFSLFLLLSGIAYLLGSLYLYTSHSDLDGKPGLSVTDVVYTYYGNRSGTILEGALRDTMSEHAPFDQKETIIRWIYDGAQETQFQETVLPILEKECFECHGKEVDTGAIYLTTYGEVMKTVEVDIGMTVRSLLRVSHVHLFGIAIFLFLIGKIFILCEIPVRLKRAAVAIPFASISLDMGSWWFTRLDPLFAYTVIIGGILMGVSVVFQILLSLYQMWTTKPPETIEDIM